VDFLFLNIPELKGLSENPFAQHNEQLYKIILAAVQLDVLCFDPEDKNIAWLQY